MCFAPIGIWNKVIGSSRIESTPFPGAVTRRFLPSNRECEKDGVTEKFVDSLSVKW